MEELIEEIEPPRDQVFDDLRKELREGHAVPVLFGSADRGNGITRLLKALRHEAPTVSATRDRLGIPAEGPPLAHVMKTIHTAHGGKLSVSRVLRGAFKEGDIVLGSRGGDTRIGGLQRLVGSASVRENEAREGDVLAFGRMEGIVTGDAFATGQHAPRGGGLDRAAGACLRHGDRDEGSQGRRAPQRRAHEARGGRSSTRHPAHGRERGTPAARPGRSASAGVVERLANRYGVEVERRQPLIGYRESIRSRWPCAAATRSSPAATASSATWRSRSSPCRAARGSSSWIASRAAWCRANTSPSVEHGVREALNEGPLGFPVVDVRVS